MLTVLYSALGVKYKLTFQILLLLILRSEMTSLLSSEICTAISVGLSLLSLLSCYKGYISALLDHFVCNDTHFSVETSSLGKSKERNQTNRKVLEAKATFYDLNDTWRN